MGSFHFCEAMLGWALTWGNGYAEIVRERGTGRPVALELLPSPSVQPDRTSAGELVYVYTPESGGSRTLAARDVFHLRGIGGDGITGWSVVRLARESIGLALGTEEYTATFFGNDASPRGILTHPEQLDEEAAKKVKASWQAAHTGGNRHKVTVLEEGMTWQSTGIPAEDAQLIESRQFSVEEICRWYRVPPHKVQHLLRSTFNNIEHQSLEYVVDTLMPWTVRWESEIKMKLLLPAERGGYFAEHLFAGLLRGDMKTRSEALQVQRRNGIINADEWREIENMNPLPDEQGLTYIVEGNMTPLGRVGEQMPSSLPPPAEDPPPDAQRFRTAHPEPLTATGAILANLIATHEELLADATKRLLRVERDKLRRAAKKDDFAAWAETFYTEHQAYIRQAVGVSIDTAADSVWSVRHGEKCPPEVKRLLMEWTQTWAQRRAQDALVQIRQSGAEKCLKAWNDEYADTIASDAMRELLETLDKAA